MASQRVIGYSNRYHHGLSYRGWIAYGCLVIFFVAVYYNVWPVRDHRVTDNTLSYPKIASNYKDDATVGADTIGQSILQTLVTSVAPVLRNETPANWKQPSLVHSTLKSLLYNVEQCSSGPIFRVQHVVNDSSQLSTCEAVGEGLRRAHVGITSFITVKLDPTKVYDFNQSFFSVLVVGEHHIFTGKPQSVAPNPTYVNFTYVPTLPGEYDVYVEEIFEDAPWQKQILGSPFRLIVEGNEINAGNFKLQTKNLPPCQTIPREDPSWIEGEWVTRKLVGRKNGVLRSGWVFQPKRCSFDIFTIDDIKIAAASKLPKTIAILGSSTERGILLSLVDLTLQKEEKINLSRSDLGKCWGFAEFQFGNLHFIYQDFRVEKAQDIYASGGSGVNITCHNEKKVEEGSKFFQDALKFLEETLFGQRLWPDIILVASPRKHLSLLLDKIPPSWNGTVYPVVNFKSKRLRFYTADGLLRTQYDAKKSLLLDPRVDVLDGFTLSTGMRHATESSPFITKANHFHRWCDELNGEMRVCGNPTEMVAQFLLGQAIAPEGKEMWIKSKEYQNREKMRLKTTRTIRVCYDCPWTLLPFHIKRKPDLSCYESTEGLHISLKENYTVWDGSPCPEECMKTKPVDKVYTQSGSADVRQCTIR